MNTFDYTKIHLFDKSGSELPLVFDPAMIIQIPNTYDDDAIFYAISSPENKIIDFYKKSSGGRFVEKDFLSFDKTTSIATVGCYIILEDKKLTSKVRVSVSKYSSNLSIESEIDEYTVNEIADKPEDFINRDILDLIGFPFITFSSSLSIDPVSVELIETQTLYFLLEENNEFIKFNESEDLITRRWAERFKLLFFIDNRQQKNFRFFDATNDEAIWSDRQICKLDSSSDSSYRVNIGFTGDEEGVYEQPLIICLLDSSCNEEQLPGIIYPIGSINLTAEAIGEDERYRTLFANFGIPDPITYHNTFVDSDINEDKIDYQLLNKHSKHIFLTYKDVFPKAGSYAALAESVAALGYTDLFFKEWYRENTDEGDKLIAEDVDDIDPNSNIIGNKPISERINLKKLNWISIIYRLNELIDPAIEDRYGFFTTRKINKYYNNDIISKLILLKKWLEKHIIGLNCKIIDVGGEGFYFERYRLAPYGSYQQVLEWNNQRNIAPFIIDNLNNKILIDSSAYIDVNIGISDNNTTLEDISNYRFGDFCSGYFDMNYLYHNMYKPTNDENNIYVGSTLETLDLFEKYSLRATCKSSNFLFGKSSLGSEQGFITDDSADLRVYNNELQFSPDDLLTYRKESVFKVLPTIQLERANIRKLNSSWNKSTVYRIYPNYENDELISYNIKNIKTGVIRSTSDYITLVPPSYRTELNETFYDNIYITPFGEKEFLYKYVSIPKITSDNPDGQPFKTFIRTNKTFGLRYSALNSYGIPFLCILGYSCPELKGFIKTNEEFCLEILDGKLVFPDYDHGRTIYLNFNYDDETKYQTVEANIVYESNEFNAVSYLVSNGNREDSDSSTQYASKLFIGNHYYDFIEAYKDIDRIDTAIKYNYDSSIKVYNSGEFIIDVFAKDSYNNLFGTSCSSKAYVYAPEIYINSYSNVPQQSSISSLISDSEYTFLKDNYHNFCIFNSDYFIRDISKVIIGEGEDRKVKFSYPSYSYSFHNAKEGDYLHFMNLSDKYLINAIDIRDDNVGEDEYSTYNMIFKKYSPSAKQRVIENDDFNTLKLMNGNAVIPCDINESSKPPKSSSEFLKQIKDGTYEFADVNFILYNEIGNYPLVQTIGTMINDRAIPYVSNDEQAMIYRNVHYIPFYEKQYRLLLTDNSYKAYIWANLRTTAEASLPKYLTSYCSDSIDNDLTLPYILKSAESYKMKDHTIDTSKLLKDEDLDSYASSEITLYNISLWILDLFKNSDSSLNLTISTSDCSTEYYLNNLKDSLNNIKNISVDEYKDREIRYGIELCFDSSVREDADYWLNLSHEIKYAILDTNYDSFKSCVATQLTNLLTKDAKLQGIEPEDFDKYIDYQLVDNSGIDSVLPSIYTIIENFVSKYYVDTEEPGKTIKDMINTMQPLYPDDYLIKSTINAVSNAFNESYYSLNNDSIINIVYTDSSSYELDESSYDNIEYSVTPKSLYLKIINNLYKEFRAVDPDMFANLTSPLDSENSLSFIINVSDEGRFLSAITSIPGVSYDVIDIKTLDTEHNEIIVYAPDAINDYISNPENDINEVFQYVINYYKTKVNIFDEILAVGNSTKYPHMKDNILGNLHSGSWQIDTVEISNVPPKYEHGRAVVGNSGYLQEICGQIYNLFLKDRSDILGDIDLYSKYYAYIVFITYAYVALVIADYMFNEAKEIDTITIDEGNNRYHLEDSNIPIKRICYELIDKNEYCEVYIERNYIDNLFLKYVSSDIVTMQNKAYQLTKAFANGLYSYLFGNEIVEEDNEITIEPTLISNLLSTEMNNEDNDEISVYNKLLENLVEYDINALNERSWVTTETVEDGKKEYLYAVAADAPDAEPNIFSTSTYYVKTPGYEQEGRIFTNYTKTYANFIGDLNETLSLPYISTYIQPTWKAKVVIRLLNAGSARSLHLEVDSSLASDDYTDYMAVEYYSDAFTWSFKKGEIVKLVFESGENNEFIGQSSYEVIGYDIFNNVVLLKGSINPAYIKKTGYEVWAEVPDEMYDELNTTFKDYVTTIDKDYIGDEPESVSTMGPALDNYEYHPENTYYSSFSNIPKREIIKQYVYEDDDTLEEPLIIPYSLPLRYYWTEEDAMEYLLNGATIDGRDITPADIADGDSGAYLDENTSNESDSDKPEPYTKRGTWFYQVMIYSDGRMYPIESSYKVADERVNVYISYAHNAYVDYTMKAEDFIENPNGITDLYVDYSKENMRKCDFIDDTFVLSIRNYNTDLGLKSWMNRVEVEPKVYYPALLKEKLISADETEDKNEYVDADIYRMAMKHYINKNDNNLIINDLEDDELEDIDIENDEPTYNYEDESFYDIPRQAIITKDKNKIAFAVDFNKTAIDENTSRVYWKVYKVLSSGKKEYMFESYNKVLYLDIKDKGIYDIEAFVYDKLGNLSATYYNAAYKII